MSEDDAKAWVRDRFGATGFAAMEQLAACVIAETEHQNLIARSTIETIWTRHILDSAQLIALAGEGAGGWLDIGSGAGFPGLVVAALTERPVTLAEPRKRRVQFLEDAATALGIADRVTVFSGKVEALRTTAEIISARAVAPLIDLFAAAVQCAQPDTLWLMPKGASARDEVAIAAHAWHGTFHVEQSLTSSQSMIVVARGVTRRCKS